MNRQAMPLVINFASARLNNEGAKTEERAGAAMARRERTRVGGFDRRLGRGEDHAPETAHPLRVSRIRREHKSARYKDSSPILGCETFRPVPSSGTPITIGSTRARPTGRNSVVR